MSRINAHWSKDGRKGAFGAQLALIRTEWAFDLDTAKFGLETGLDTAGQFVYVKVLFGPFQFGIVVKYGDGRRGRPEDNKEQKGKDQVSGP